MDYLARTDNSYLARTRNVNYKIHTNQLVGNFYCHFKCVL